MQPRIKNIRKKQTDKDKKKIISTRISKVLLNSMKNAVKDLDNLGYEVSSIATIFENALMDTLEDAQREIGIDYYRLEVFRDEMTSLVDSYQLDMGDMAIDNTIEKIKKYALNLPDTLERRRAVRHAIRDESTKIKEQINEYKFGKNYHDGSIINTRK